MQNKPQEFLDYKDAAAVAAPDQWPAIVRIECDNDRFGQTIERRYIWALFDKPHCIGPRDVEMSGPYAGTYSDEAVGF